MREEDKLYIVGKNIYTLTPKETGEVKI